MVAITLLVVTEPKPPTEEESADVIFSKSFVGKTYDDDLEVEGWDEVDGGLVAPPIYVHRYLREDGTYLVITSRQLAKDALNIARQQGAFTIWSLVDALTRLSRQVAFAGDRTDADQKAAGLLALAA